MGSSNVDDCDDGQKYRIAIIGASYAGLTLANVLERFSKDNNVSYCIFDGKSMPFTYITGGKEFDVPFYHSGLVPQLLLKNLNDDDCNYKNKVVTRKEVTEQLLKHVNKECLFTQTKIINIVSKTKQINKPSSSLSSKVVFYLHVHSSSSNSLSSYGPYDAVVGSDGVRSLVRPYGKKGMYVIGDARWVASRWYDFGTKRIQQGANIAMIDAYTFGHQLLKQQQQTTNQTTTIDKQYCTYEIQKQMNQQKQQIFIILIILISILFYNNTYDSQ